MLDPGTIIALTQIGYNGACLAISTFRTALNYPADSENVVLKLELERFRLQTWGTNAGVSSGTLESSLLPVSDLITQQLKLIENLFKDASHLQERYGLLSTSSSTPQEDKVQRFVSRMRRSIRASGIKLNDADSEDHGLENKETDSRNRARTLKRARWAIQDKDRFSALVSDLESHVDKLNQLLSETQRRHVREDNERIDIIVVDSADDHDSINLVKDAANDKRTSCMRARIERKAIVDDRTWTSRIAPETIGALKLDDFQLPPEFFRKSRMLARLVTNPEKVFLFERKDFDPDISPQDKNILWNRIQRLVMVLRGPESSEFQTPVSKGFIHDPQHFCWWLVFSFDAMMHFHPEFGPETQPVSLLALLQPKSKFKPPLELRWKLANAMCITMSELYSSGWLHKGIRSENILFPCLHVAGDSVIDPSFAIMSRPLISGFEYSRQETEARTIDKSKSSTNVMAALYRHPSYQGEAAQGYRIAYDIYSVGLVLLEIALWVPLMTFLDAKDPKSAVAGYHGPLSSEMKHFHRDEAVILRKRVLSRVDKELAFRTGSVYCEVVEWCLTFADRSTNIGEETEPPALQFYNKVVVPLCRLCAVV
jgi:hypothetical protein